MFKFVKDRIVKNWPEKVQVALDNGRTQAYPITLDLKILPTSDYRELAAQGDKALIAEIVQGWSGVCDEAGEPLVCSDEHLDLLSEHVGFSQAVIRAYLQASSGEGSRKN